MKNAYRLKPATHPLASHSEGGGPRKRWGSVLKENIVLLSQDTPPVSFADSPLSEGAKKNVLS